MDTEELRIRVGKKSYRLVSGLASFLAASKVALDDGFQPGDDLPDIASSAFTDLIPVVSDFAEIKAEMEENPDQRAVLAALLFNEIMALF